MKKWLQNFWYYYKIPVIVILVVLAAGIYLILTHRGNVSSDYDAAVVSPRAFSVEQISQIQSVLEGAGRDQNGDGKVVVTVHVYRFAIGMDGQDTKEVAGLDADLVGKQSGIFFTDTPEQFEKSTNGICRAADAIPVSEIPLLSGFGIDDLFLLIRTDADQRYIEMHSVFTE